MPTSGINRRLKVKRLQRFLNQQQAVLSSVPEPEKSEMLRVIRAASTATGLLPPRCPRTCSKTEDILRCVADGQCFIECFDTAKVVWAE